VTHSGAGIDFRTLVGFDWDDGNRGKSWRRHGVRDSEAEEVLSEAPLLVAPDVGRSWSEPRFLALERTRTRRRLLVAFTVRADRLRIVSARDMSRKERRSHAEAGREEFAAQGPQTR
jgi:uncharacterized DUF497 family protein